MRVCKFFTPGIEFEISWGAMGNATTAAPCAYGDTVLLSAISRTHNEMTFREREMDPQQSGQEDWLKQHAIRNSARLSHTKERFTAFVGDSNADGITAMHEHTTRIMV
jgi:hypothetical protein